MTESTLDIEFRATDEFSEFTAHGLLAAAVMRAKQDGFFTGLQQRITLKMKKREYSVAEKFETLWASIVVGCDHTVEINTKLGAHEPALAALFGLSRFPDQSQISRLLSACSPETLTQVRTLHRHWMGKFSRAARRRLWHRLATGRRVLVVDLDQRALVVSGTTYKLATKGHFGRKRGKLGYQLSVAYLGGAVGEVLDEWLDPGKTQPGARIEQLLESVAWLCDRHRIAPRDVVLRADALYGTVGLVERAQAYGFSYFLKGVCPARARRLVRGATEQAVFERVQAKANGEAHWLTDLGELEHEGAPIDGSQPRARTRTLAGVWVRKQASKADASKARKAKARGGGGDPAPERRRVSYESYMTNLTSEELPVDHAYEFYTNRVTIERYFNDEQNALGARYVRSHHVEGAAVFQWMVAMVNNQLRRLQRTDFHETVLERVGLKRLVKVAMQVPALVRRSGERLIVRLPKRHEVVRQLAATWSMLLPECDPHDPSAVASRSG